MTTRAAVNPAIGITQNQRRTWRAMAGLRRFVSKKPLGALGLFFICVVLVVAAVPQAFERTDPNTVDPFRILEGPGSSAWFGTDQLGRDIYSRVVHGARIAAVVGFGAVAIAAIIGTTIGIVSGYYGGWVDLVVQRFMDAILAFPPLVLALSVVVAIGPSVGNLVFALAFVSAPSFSRIVRASTLSVRQMTYVEAAVSIGQSTPLIILRHILPNVAAPILVVATGAIGSAILVESGLSFLGLGPPPPNATWGSMLSLEARFYLTTAWWLAVVPGVAISLTVLAFNLLGDALRDVLDPRLRGR
ncbi:MAG: ABC transporter permease [Dehalococcoidia bacterium]|nr:ABC transporter permease [Dehalococcoidia bacterium]